MPSVLHFPNRQARAAASVVLLLATVLVLIVEHVTVSASLGEARMPEKVVASARTVVTQAVAAHPTVEANASSRIQSVGPGGAQPWVRWSYIP